MSILHKLKWRYAAKRFNSDRLIEEVQVTEVLTAVNLSASSLGLQPYEVVVVHNKQLQKILRKHSFNQPQVEEASHVLVFAAKIGINDTYVDAYIERTARLRKQKSTDLDEYKKMIVGFLGKKNVEEISTWIDRQIYIALGTALVAAADQKIDSCPMEGFIPEKYDEVLGLKKLGLRSVVILPLGYRSHEDELATKVKSRKPLDELVHLRY